MTTSNFQWTTSLLKDGLLRLLGPEAQLTKTQHNVWSRLQSNEVMVITFMVFSLDPDIVVRAVEHLKRFNKVVDADMKQKNNLDYYKIRVFIREADYRKVRQ